MATSSSSGLPSVPGEALMAPTGSSAPAEADHSSLNAAALKERRQRRRLRIKKLEKKLELLDRRIRKCAEAELSLGEMESGNSAYMKEDYLKRVFVKTWQELCQLQRVNDSIAIEDEESAKYSGTPYPEVNRRVQRLLRLDEFPDYVDIVQLLDRCNTKHSLGIAAEEKSHLARKVFKEVGKLIQRRRHRDFVGHFGSHLTDTFQPDQDPALQDNDLLTQLQESLKEGERKIAAIVEEFVQKQEQEYCPEKSPEGDSCSANEPEEEEKEEEAEGEEEGEEGEEEEEVEEEGMEEEEVEEEEGEEEEEEEEKEELINVVDGSGSEVERETHLEGIAEEMEVEEEEEEEEEEEKEDSSFHPSSSVPDITPDSTVPSEPSESLVTTTHLHVTSTEEETPGPSGLTVTQASLISSSSEVICVDDDDELIIISD